EVAATKKVLGFDPKKSFDVAESVIAHTRKLAARSVDIRVAWQEKFDAWAAANPENKALFDRLSRRELPEGFDAELPTWEPDDKGVATRKASEATLQAPGKT
ncbi:transketolase, partial [Pseudomonas otitidis]|nr:transketolase [Pseudomonas otitidis]